MILLRAKSPAGVRVYRIHSGTSYLYSSNPFAEYQCFFVHYKSHTFLLGILRDYVENKLKHLRRRIAPLFRQCRFTGFRHPGFAVGLSAAHWTLGRRVRRLPSGTAPIPDAESATGDCHANIRDLAWQPPIRRLRWSLRSARGWFLPRIAPSQSSEHYPHLFRSFTSC